MNYDLIIYAVCAVVLLLAVITIFILADRLGMAEYERDLFKYELQKLQAYRNATE
jgi:hypothetical protein